MLDARRRTESALVAVLQGIASEHLREEFEQEDSGASARSPTVIAGTGRTRSAYDRKVDYDPCATLSTHNDALGSGDHPHLT
jgi:hypothetical protein